ncbi:hypothetical protein IQ26_05512 [Mesorhizobium tianshanense]|uniref:Uncharacterized protein n=1 Tax=Mesorhizobium tianshanense TaxID=39844 RepID=A0A562N7C3_9HYPH|nr:hypothetical protein IQ26_05512 [Mesorhizobium tianshanense]
MDRRSIPRADRDVPARRIASHRSRPGRLDRAEKRIEPIAAGGRRPDRAEALRATQGKHAPPGLLRGLADAHVAEALRQLHSDRFTRTVGLRPMEHLLGWRMAVAKNAEQGRRARRSCAAGRLWFGKHIQQRFSRHVGQLPGRYARRDRRDEGRSCVRPRTSDATDEVGVMIHESDRAGGLVDMMLSSPWSDDHVRR